jgi:hypothetical protein
VKADGLKVVLWKPCMSVSNIQEHDSSQCLERVNVYDVRHDCGHHMEGLLKIALHLKRSSFTARSAAICSG